MQKMLVGSSSDTTQVQDKGSFADIVTNTVNDTEKVLKTAEQATIGNVMGTVPVDELAIAVSSAETSLKTMMAIRDRVINAYQDIIKMPI